MGVSSALTLSLGEGSTPLVAADRLSAESGYDLHLKCEGANPTGSFKDRGMVVAVGRAADSGARAVVCASTGNTAASAAAYAARAGLVSIVLTPAGATATAKRAQAVAAGATLLEIRGSFDDALRICRELGERPGYVLVNSVNPDRIEGQKSVVFELLEQLGAVPDVIALPFGGGGNVTAVAAGLDDAGVSSRIVVGEAAERTTTWATAIRIAAPAHAEHVAELVASGRVVVVTLSESEIRDRLATARRRGGRLLRAGVGRRARCPAAGGARLRRDRRLHPHRPRAQGHRRARGVARRDGRRRESRRGAGGGRMSWRVVAPASTANLGPAFDSAAAALDLWNEVVVEEADGDATVLIEGEGADELPRDASHLSLRAFALFAPVDRYRFSFVNRIPLERGLGSSAAAIALGLVAGRAVAGTSVTPDELLAHAVELEGHADNVAAALLGGVCVSWHANGAARAARIAADLPLASIFAVPAGRTNTSQSRNGLPATVTHADAAANAGYAAMLGAAIASGDAALLADAFHDRLHEQHRLDTAPLLRLLQTSSPDGVVGLTLSGSGPSVVVWAARERADDVAADLRVSLPDDTRVLSLRIAQEGARLA